MQEAERKNESLHGLEDIYGEPICKLESLKLLEQDDDRVWLTKRGIDVSNSVFVEFLLEE